MNLPRSFKALAVVVPMMFAAAALASPAQAGVQVNLSFGGLYGGHHGGHRHHQVRPVRPRRVERHHRQHRVERHRHRDSWSRVYYPPRSHARPPRAPWCEYHRTRHHHPAHRDRFDLRVW